MIEALAPAMRAAGRLIETIRLAGAAHRQKLDASPVTEADEAAERLLTSAIRSIDWSGVIIGEEAHAAGECDDAQGRFWLIDPLDGTKDFIAGSPAYSVNIGLVVGGVPVLGLVLSPRDGTLWAGAAGCGAFREAEGGKRQPIATRSLAEPPVAVVSHSHIDRETQDWVHRAGAISEPAGSSLKFCRLAEGSADLYPRYGPTSEWDTAAGHAILLAAGGAVRASGGDAFAYGKSGFRNGGFLAVGDPSVFDRLPPL